MASSFGVVRDRAGHYRVVSYHENMGCRAIEGRVAQGDELVETGFESQVKAMEQADNLNAVREVLTS